jgi:hypothetical protein
VKSWEEPTIATHGQQHLPHHHHTQPTAFYKIVTTHRANSITTSSPHPANSINHTVTAPQPTAFDTSVVTHSQKHFPIITTYSQHHLTHHQHTEPTTFPNPHHQMWAAIIKTYQFTH